MSWPSTLGLSQILIHVDELDEPRRPEGTGTLPDSW